MNFFLWHQWSLAGFFLVLLGIAILNLLGFPSLRRAKPATTPKVSVLIPVRDEEENVEECVASVLGQDYPDFEVLIHEEGSRDQTKAILSRLSDLKLRVIFGNEPPPGWLGKPDAKRRRSGSCSPHPLEPERVLPPFPPLPPAGGRGAIPSPTPGGLHADRRP